MYLVFAGPPKMRPDSEPNKGPEGCQTKGEGGILNGVVAAASHAAKNAANKKQRHEMAPLRRQKKEKRKAP